MTAPTPEASPGLAAVRAWCGWHVAPSKVETLEVEGVGGRVLLLPSLHVEAVSEIRNEAGSVVTGWRARRNGVVRGCWREHDLYSVDVTHGYDALPDELVAIVARLDAEGVGSRRVASQSAGPFAQTFGASVDLESQPLSTRAVIARYALPPRP